MARPSSVRAIVRSRPVARIAAPVLRPILRRFSLEQIARSRVLSAAVRAPIATPWFTIRAPGGERLVLSSTFAPHLYWAGLPAFEPDLVPSFLARIGSARRFVDVGANFGFYSILAAATNPTAAIDAVEPNPALAALLKETAARNGVKLAVHELALSDRGGTASLSLRGGLSSLVAARWEQDDVLQRVRTERFDDLFPDGADLVKIDAEGAEPEVLAGMERALVGCRPTILCEVSVEHAGAVAELARGHRYRILSLPGERPTAEIEVETGSVNVVLEPEPGSA